jgi:hypothetical protein
MALHMSDPVSTKIFAKHSHVQVLSVCGVASDIHGCLRDAHVLLIGVRVQRAFESQNRPV